MVMYIAEILWHKKETGDQRAHKINQSPNIYLYTYIPEQKNNESYSEPITNCRNSRYPLYIYEAAKMRDLIIANK